MKKFISMALALVMTLSLCTFITVPEADAFEDTDDLPQYSKQAIDVIQTIEVMTGYEDNTFKPDATLTRQAAAKIICNMILGPIAAKALPTNEAPFPDVAPGTEWAGYISYCSHEKIINGYSDNTFKPTGALTGYAFLKMLLGTLGYSVEAEGFTGANWKVNVAKIALGIKLNKGITSDPDGENLEQGVTREDAAIYAFNTIQGDMVEYPSQNSININGVTVSMGSGKASPQTWTTSTTSANNINSRRDTGVSGFIGGTYTGYPIVQFAERYFDKLVRTPNVWDDYTTDDFGRPSIKWSWKGVSIGTYSRDPDVCFVGNPKVNAIYEALKMDDSDNEGRLYINSSIPNNDALRVSRSNDKALDHSSNLLMFVEDDVKNGKSVDQVRADHNLVALGGVAGARLVTRNDIGHSMDVYGDGSHRVDRFGDGTLVECYRNEATNQVDICVISIYGGRVDSVKPATTKKDRYVTVVFAPDDQANHRPDSIAAVGNNEFETEDFEEEDYVAYTYSDSAPGIKDMYYMTENDGSLISRVKEENITLDDTTYYYAKEYAFYEMTENDLSNKSAYVVYTFRWADVEKYTDLLNDEDEERVLWIEEDEFAVDQYVLIERITIENRNGRYVSDVINPVETPPSAVQAVVRTSSGARRTYNLDDSKNYRDADNDTLLTVAAIAPAFRAGRIVRVSTNSNGTRLHSVDDKYTVLAVPNFTISGKDIWTGNPKNAVFTDGPDTIRRLIVDSETHFTVEDAVNQTYKEYLGTKNVPDVDLDGGGAGGIAYIYHRGSLAKQIFITSANNVTSSSRDVIFFLAPSTSNLVESDDGNYYDVVGIEKDEVTRFKVRAGTAFWETGSYFEPGSGIPNTKNEGNCVILNKLTYDSNNLVTAGEFDSRKVQAHAATGIRRVNDEEVRFDTATNESYIRDVADNVRVFFCEGSNIEQIDYADIINDTRDAIYYVENDNSVVTYIFIVNFEDDGWPTNVVRPDFELDVEGTTIVDDALAAVPGGYTVSVNGGAPKYVYSFDAESGVNNTITFRVSRNDVLMTSADINVGLYYKDRTNAWTTHLVGPASEVGGVWTINVPVDNGLAGDIDSDPTNIQRPIITLVVRPIG